MKTKLWIAGLAVLASVSARAGEPANRSLSADVIARISRAVPFSVADVPAIPVQEPDRTEERNRALERRFGLRPVKVIDVSKGTFNLIDDESLFPSFLEDIIVLGNELSAKYRGGYILSPGGTFYLRGGIMYNPRGSPWSYGVKASKGRTGTVTGPAMRIKF